MKYIIRLTFLLIFALYIPSISSDFVYDSLLTIFTSPYVHQSSNFLDVLSFKVLSQDVMDGNRPIVLLSYMIDSVFWDRNPTGYHLSNNIIHAFNSALICVFLFQLINKFIPDENKNILVKSLPVLLALAFGAHPLASEAVCEVSYREDLLASFFVLAAILVAATINSNKSGKVILLITIPLLQLLAIGSKEMGICLTPIVFTYWVLFKKEESRKFTFILFSVSGITALAFLMARFHFQPENSIIFKSPPTAVVDSFGGWFILQCRLWSFQFMTIFNPELLCHYHVAETVTGMKPAIAVSISTLLFIFIAYFSWKSPICRLGAIIIITALAPVANIIPIYRPLADRYMYFPLAGISIFIAGIIILTAENYKAPKTIYRVACGIIIILLPLLAYFTLERQKAWSNSISLAKEAFEKHPNHPKVMQFLAEAYYHDKQHLKAEELYMKSVEIGKNASANVLASLAAINFTKQDKKKALMFINKAIEVDNRYNDPDALLESLDITKYEAQKLRDVLKHFNLLKTVSSATKQQGSS